MKKCKNQTHLQFVARYAGFDEGQDRGIYDFKIETSDSGSLETISNGNTVEEKHLPTGLGEYFTMDSKETFTALKHMLNMEDSLHDAFGGDLSPSEQGAQFQGVVAMKRPEWLHMHPNCSCNSDNSIELMAFLYKDGYLMISTMDSDGFWHSDAEKAKKALEGLTFEDLAAIIGKIMAEIQLSIWIWSLIGICAVITGGAGAIGCALLLMALELVTLTMLIAIIEEVTGNKVQLTALHNAEKNVRELQFGTAKRNLRRSRKQLVAYIDQNLENRNLGEWLKDKTTLCGNLT